MTELLYVRWNPKAESWEMEARVMERAAEPPRFEGCLPPSLNLWAGDATLARAAAAEHTLRSGRRSSRVVVLRPRTPAVAHPS